MHMLQVRMESAKRMFQTVDADDSGFIDPIEFQRFMRKLDATMSATDIKLALGYATLRAQKICAGCSGGCAELGRCAGCWTRTATA